MNRLLPLLAVAIAATLTAQNVTLTALNPAVASVLLNGQTFSTTLPSGPVPIPTSGAFVYQAGTGTDQALMNWTLNTSIQQTGVQLEHRYWAIAQSAAPTQASLTGGDLLLALSNPIPLTCQVQITIAWSQPVGQWTQSLQVDIGNDGSNEFTLGSPVTYVTANVVIGPAALPVRIQSQANLMGQGTLTQLLIVRIVPIGRFVPTQQIVGCDPGYSQRLMPRFDGGLNLDVMPPLSGPIALPITVIGLNLQPALLPFPQLSPCLLLPSLDILEAFSPQVTIPAPPSMMSGGFWTQVAVAYPPFTIADITTTNGYRVDIY